MDQQSDLPSSDPISVETPAAKPRRKRAAEAALSRMVQAAEALSAAENKEASAPADEPKASPQVASQSLVVASPLPAADIMPPSAKSDTSPRNLPLFAAALCLALGIGGALGTQISANSEPNVAATDETAKIEKALPWKRDVAEAGVRDSSKLRDDLRALRSEVAALRTNSEQLRQAEMQKQGGELRALRVLMEAQKGETASLKADVTARFDRADREAAQRGDKLAERVDRMEKRLADPAPTATTSKTTAEPAKADKPVRGIVLRQVSRGVALIESRRGMMEIMVGDQVPGAGRVEAIEKHAGRWRVVTSTGVIDDTVE